MPPQESAARYMIHPVFPSLVVILLADPPHVEKLARNSCWSSWNDAVLDKVKAHLRTMRVKLPTGALEDDGTAVTMWASMHQVSIHAPPV
jgi:hypothetical protein